MTIGRELRRAAWACAISSLVLLAGSAARADARCTVRVIHALDPATATPEQHKQGAHGDPVKIDPRIDRLRPYLVKPPFTAWHEFVLLDKRSLELAPKVAQQVALPNGKIASLTFLEHLEPTDGKHHRVRMQLQIDGPKKLDTVFVVHEGGVVLQAGQHYQGGLLVLGFSCDQPHDQAKP